jgi:uncharacterized protein YprB with RNaseH-like and TPR domain
VSTLAERLRNVVGPIGPTGAGARDRGAGSATPACVDAEAADGERSEDPAETLGGQWRESRGQRFVVIERKYSPGHRHGRMAVADSLPPEDGMWPFLPLLAGTTCRGRLLFVDLETTGLAGGAGSYAFLVGCAWFDATVFRVRQFFLSSFAGERGLLEAVAETAELAGTLVTFNGKSFDMPLMETRFTLHRMETPFAGMPHVDMVHPARRLWRGDDERQGPSAASVPAAAQYGDCRLSTLEDVLCGHRREGDVPGFEIPSRYFHYVRSGNARALEPVLEHNRLDLLALALVTAHASQLLEGGPGAARTPREALGMGRLYERAGLASEARAAFDRAAQMPRADSVTRAAALRAYAVLSRRHRLYEDAAAAWRRLLDLRGCPAAVSREATEALAVHHEHRLRDPFAARTFALQSMSLPQTPARREAVQHRLARLNRKLGERPLDMIPLF